MTKTSEATRLSSGRWSSVAGDVASILQRAAEALWRGWPPTVALCPDAATVESIERAYPPPCPTESCVWSVPWRLRGRGGFALCPGCGAMLRSVDIHV